MVILGLAIILMSCLAGWIKWKMEKDAFLNCKTQSEFKEFAQKTYFFRSECVDSLSCFATLVQSKTPINDALNTENKDSIRVNWSDDCSLKQLRMLKRIINNMMFNI